MEQKTVIYAHLSVLYFSCNTLKCVYITLFHSTCQQTVLPRICSIESPFDPPTQSVTCYSYTMGTSGLSDMYTRSLRAAGPRAEGVYIRQTTSAHGITDMCHGSSHWQMLSSSSQKSHIQQAPHYIYREAY